MKRFIAITIALALVLSTMGLTYASTGYSPSVSTESETLVATTDSDSSSNEEITFLITSDMHSNLEEIAGVGGISRISTLYQDTLADNSQTFLLDGGDFAMGTPFQVIFQTDASEIRLMGEVGYDATVLGNHEFDHRTEGLTNMLTTATSSGDALPEIVISNIDWDSTFADEDLVENATALKEASDEYGISDYTVIEKDGATIAVFGLMGTEADSYAPESGLIFQDPIESAQETVADIEANEDVDLIVCLSHSGLNLDDSSKSEDELLAQAVPEIDLIVSGHSHTTLYEPIIYGDTAIGACGEYTQNVAEVTFEKTDDGYSYKSYELIPLDSSIEQDEDIEALVAEFRSLIDTNYFDYYGYSIDQVLGTNTVDFGDFSDFGVEQGEETLGNFLSDSIIYAVEKCEGEDYEEVSVSVVPSGVIRASLPTGEITTETIFNILSLGIGPDGMSGYPMVSLYLTGADLKTAAEIDISVSEFMPTARLYSSGLQYTYNTNRLLLNRVTDVNLVTQDGSIEEIDDDKLYRVVTDLYSCQMLGTVEGMSFGLLSVTPRNSDGSEMTDYEANIIYTEDGKELKQWNTVAMYFDSFEDGTVPDEYNYTDQRKVDETSSNIIDILKNPNKFFWILLGVVVLLVAIITLVTVFIVKKVKKRKARKIKESSESTGNSQS